MANLFEAFKAAMAQAGPGLVYQMQGKDELAQKYFEAGANQAELDKRRKDRQFSNDMRMQEMALKIQQAKDSNIVRKRKEERDEAMFQLKMKRMQEGQPDNLKMQQIKDTFNAETGNLTMFDPSRPSNNILDAVTGKPVKKVYTGVQNRFDVKDARAVGKELAKETVRQAPTKTVLNSLDVLDELLDKGEAAVNKTEPIFGMRVGFTGKWRNAIQGLQRVSGMFEMDEVDNYFEQFNSRATQVLAQQVRSFTGAQATDAERQFLALMGPQPTLSPAANRIRIKELRAMMQFIDKRNAGIEARLGRPLKDISKHIVPGQDLQSYYINNVKGKMGVVDPVKDEPTPEQNEKLNEYLNLERRKVELYKKLQRK